MKVAIVGATGLVGQTMIRILEERKFPVSKLIPVASEKSSGSIIHFYDVPVPIVTLEESLKEKPELALLSAGSDISLKYSPLFTEKGSIVIDNSSAWRMHPEIKLVVPEINAAILTRSDKIIANPNCSTIQMVMVLSPLHERFRIHRIIVSTYQSVTGTGIQAIRQMENERSGISADKVYPHPIDKNCLPHCDSFLDNGYTKEEMKLVHETQKILDDPSIRISATAVRVPVTGGHSEAVNIEFGKHFELDEIYDILAASPGVTVVDNPEDNRYPMPITVNGKDSVFVGRIRKDLSGNNSLNLWIVADNLRKGAATNAIQIAEYLLSNKFI
ncbi:MAG: aspartate-semialdehyde dehydrogenase [Bacteroidales bacterium]|nr:MAG: aspartate-semialdehyde dehydrogenase [Bacteroidales bacterium]